MRHRARGFGNDRGIPGIGLGLTFVQIRNAAHRQSRQIGHLNPLGAGDCDRQRSNRGRLIDNQQQRAVYLQSGDQDAQFSLVVGQGLIQQAFA